MHPDSFYQRYETRRPRGGLVYDDVPDRVRDGVANVVHRGLLSTTTALLITGDIAEEAYYALDRRMPDRNWADADPLEGLLYSTPWDEFCTICEVIYAQFRQKSTTAADTLSNRINVVFSRNYFGYEMRDGRIERVGARDQDAAIAQARGILRDPDLTGPDQQYQKAIGFYNRRPLPDCENCVKEAVSAVEGVARIVLNDHSLTLSRALQRLRRDKDVHPTLLQLLEKLYGYRSDAQGVGHALTGEKEVRLEEAEFVLSVSASAIVYLARLYGRAVE
jgi:hypothetical protein